MLFSECIVSLSHNHGDLRIYKFIMRNRYLFLLTIGASIFFFLMSSKNIALGQLDKTPWSNSTDTIDSRHKGAHIFGEIDSTNLLPFVQQNINWLTLVPFCDQKDYNSAQINFYGSADSIKLQKRKSAWKKKISIAHTLGMKVMIKPHVWIYGNSNGKWRSDVYPENEDDWEAWGRTYRDFIMMYLQIAIENEVEAFCVGTELTRLSLEKPEYWQQLIRDIRAKYSGELTYAANWYEEYENITFWEELDYIGVQAYFPLTKRENPSLDDLSKGWRKYLPKLEKVSRKNDRPILFTEMGYKSTSDSAIEPWTWVQHSTDDDMTYSAETQATCYQSFFDNVWNQSWFAGVHIWQMRSDVDYSQYNGNTNFTPQGKLAEEVIRLGFEKK